MRRPGDALAELLARYGGRGSAWLRGLTTPPLASVVYGAGGVAYTFYRLGRTRGDPGLAGLAGKWLERASAGAEHPKAFYDADRGFERSTLGEVSLFHSPAGLHCIAALLAIAREGSAAAAHDAVAAFIAYSRKSNDSPDLITGAAGLLLGCAELIEAAPAVTPELDPVRARGDEIAAELLQILRSEKIATSTRITYIGVAVGWAGLLLALLRWELALHRRPDPLIATKLDELATLAVPVHGGLCWTVLNNSRTFMPGWCNGNSGHVMLFSLAYKVLGSERYRALAVESARGAWMFKSLNGSLCCGNGGTAYAFLAAYRITGDGIWLRRARYAARRANIPVSEYHLEDSLYKGALGVALLNAELEMPSTAAMPLCEPTRYAM